MTQRGGARAAQKASSRATRPRRVPGVPGTGECSGCSWGPLSCFAWRHSLRAALCLRLCRSCP
eukprot:6793192-Pyramimonas_sp.AAC.1